MIISELYHEIDGKKVKSESNYYHYTNIDTFHKIVSSLIKGEGLKGSYYPANTNTYGELTPKGKRLPNELCLVRSDRVPDHLKKLNLSGNSGDIKFTFKEDKVVNKFGKIKPIGEYPVQDKKWIKKSVVDCRNNLTINAPVAEKILKNFETKYHSMSKEDALKNSKKLELFLKNPKKAKELYDNYLEYHDGRNTEHMESRIRIPEGKYITLEFIDQIYIPDYLKDNKEILADITKLKMKGFNNISFYKCKYPKEEV